MKLTSLTTFTYLKSQELDGIFPNISIALRIFLSTAVVNCTGEQSFSVLKQVKNYMRFTMTEERLNALALSNIKNELLNVIDLNTMVFR